MIPIDEWQTFVTNTSASPQTKKWLITYELTFYALDWWYSPYYSESRRDWIEIAR